MMAKIVKSAYVKFGVQKTNRAISAIVSACAAATVVIAIGTAYNVGRIEGFEDAANLLHV